MAVPFFIPDTTSSPNTGTTRTGGHTQSTPQPPTNSTNPSSSGGINVQHHLVTDHHNLGAPDANGRYTNPSGHHFAPATNSLYSNNNNNNNNNNMPPMGVMPPNFVHAAATAAAAIQNANHHHGASSSAGQVNHSHFHYYRGAQQQEQQMGIGGASAMPQQQPMQQQQQQQYNPLQQQMFAPPPAMQQSPSPAGVSSPNPMGQSPQLASPINGEHLVRVFCDALYRYSAMGSPTMFMPQSPSCCPQAQNDMFFPHSLPIPPIQQRPRTSYGYDRSLRMHHLQSPVRRLRLTSTGDDEFDYMSVHDTSSSDGDFHHGHNVARERLDEFQGRLPAKKKKTKKQPTPRLRESSLKWPTFVTAAVIFFGCGYLAIR